MTLPDELAAPQVGEDLPREVKGILRFRRWLISAPFGNSTVYHTGMLLWDRDKLGGNERTTDALADYVWRAHRLGLAELTQQRLRRTEITPGERGESYVWGSFAYRATRTAVPWPGDQAFDQEIGL